MCPGAGARHRSQCERGAVSPAPRPNQARGVLFRQECSHAKVAPFVVTASVVTQTGLADAWEGPAALVRAPAPAPCPPLPAHAGERQADAFLFAGKCFGLLDLRTGLRAPLGAQVGFGDHWFGAWTPAGLPWSIDSQLRHLINM